MSQISGGNGLGRGRRSEARANFYRRKTKLNKTSSSDKITRQKRIQKRRSSLCLEKINREDDGFPRSRAKNHVQIHGEGRIEGGNHRWKRAQTLKEKNQRSR